MKPLPTIEELCNPPGDWGNGSAGAQQVGRVEPCSYPERDLAEDARVFKSPTDALNQRAMDRSLTFRQFSTANLTRSRQSFPHDGWSLGDWGNAMAGECGEACNFVKKLRRIECGGRGNAGDILRLRDAIGKELGDVIAYADLLAQAIGLDLGTIVRAKFNEISDRVGSPVKL